jgi:hypothetical protein
VGLLSHTTQTVTQYASSFGSGDFVIVDVGERKAMINIWLNMRRILATNL